MTVDEFQYEALKLALPQCKTLEYMVLGLCNEAGEVAGKLKKVQRKDRTIEDARADIVKELGDVAWYLAGACSMCDVYLSNVLQGNIDKLKSRHIKGTLQGDGDNR